MAIKKFNDMVKNTPDQKGLQKNTSIQSWGELIEKTFNQSLRIETRKDREHIYSLLVEMGLPYERFIAFKSGLDLTKEKFFEAVGDLGIPYWISATPKIGIEGLSRISKLRLESSADGWQFLETLSRREDYKIIVMQYADEPDFKGIVLVSKSLNGIADFVGGDRHYQLTSGLTMTDPMLFNRERIIHYSQKIDKKHQDLLYSYVSDKAGHFEFQYGVLDKKRCLSFFDYNDEPAYEDIDSLFEDLIVYFEESVFEQTEDVLVRGLPASLGKVNGQCRIILSSDFDSFASVKEGEVLVTDVTTPEMTPIMKKVCAIVADLGGVTSHAAIVCRELKIPAIVGTKNGTSVLKNGQRVEVDAFKGVIKLLSS